MRLPRANPTTSFFGCSLRSEGCERSRAFSAEPTATGEQGWTVLRRKQLAECAQHLNSRITHHLRQSQGRLQTPHPAPRQHNPRRSWTSEIRAKLAGTAMLKPQRDRRRACVIEVRCHLIVAKFCPSNPNGAKLNQKYEPTPDGLSVSAHGRLFAVLAPPSPRLVPALYCPLGALHLHRGVPGRRATRHRTVHCLL